MWLLLAKHITMYITNFPNSEILFEMVVGGVTNYVKT
jgi:hypothetical protein